MRTIYDLNVDELIILFYTAMPNIMMNAELIEAACALINYEVDKVSGLIKFRMAYDTGDCWDVIINNKLSIYVFYEGGLDCVFEQAKYIDKIREMLSKDNNAGVSN